MPLPDNRVLTIVVRTKFRGIHYWANAPEEVAHLANPHRHTFNVSVVMPVFHDDRDKEFLLMQDLVDKVIQDSYPQYKSFYFTKDLGGRSCEMICKELWCLLSVHAGIMAISVDEDGENGATLSL